MAINEHQRATVLVALDGSPAAAASLPIAFAVATQLNADCQVLHVVADSGPFADLRRPFDRGIEALTGIKVHEHVIAPAVQFWQMLVQPGVALSKAMLHMEVRVDTGDAAAGILRASADPAVALVVLTTHGHVIEAGRTLGRVAEMVVAGATRPILLIRPEAISPFSIRDARLQRLLLPLDGTPTTAALLGPVLELATRLKAAIDVLYVIDSQTPEQFEAGSVTVPRYVDQPQHEWPQWTNEVIDWLHATAASVPVPMRVFVRHGNVAAEIDHFAAQERVDAVVLARRSHLEPGRAYVLRTVLNHTPCPVVLVGDPADTTGERVVGGYVAA